MTLPHLNISDPNFSTRSVEIEKARNYSFCATTPFGLAIFALQRGWSTFARSQIKTRELCLA